MTTDEELDLLEDSLRRLKVEYDVYFGGGSRRPPNDLDSRVQSLVKKFSDSQKLTAQQRFRYNGMAQRFAIFSDVWRKKLRVKEEGYRRPQDVLLGVQGVRVFSDESGPSREPAPLVGPSRSAVLSFQADESGPVRELYAAVTRARDLAGESRPGGSLETFASFLRAKTKELQAKYGCLQVKYTVDAKDGRVRIKARPSP